MSIEIQGLSSLMKKLESLKLVTQQRVLVAAAKKAMVPVLEQAQQLAPKDTGALSEGLVLGSSTKGSGDTVAAAGIKLSGAARSRWHFAEFGTSKQPARPFLRPALHSKKTEALEIFRKEIAAGIERAVKRQHAQSLVGQVEKFASKVSRKAKRATRKLKKAARAASRSRRRQR